MVVSPGSGPGDGGSSPPPAATHHSVHGSVVSILKLFLACFFIIRPTVPIFSKFLIWKENRESSKLLQNRKISTISGPSTL